MRIQRRGVTMIIALITMGLVSATLLTLANQSTAETKAVGNRAETDQLDQLLMASIESSLHHLDQPATAAQSWTITLPHELSDANVQLKSHPTSAADAEVHVEARLRARKSAQTIRLHFDGQWRLASVQLD